MSPQSKKQRRGNKSVTTSAAGGSPPKAEEPTVRQVPAVIGEFLQAHYRNLVDAPVPDHLVRLVEMLEQREMGVTPAGGMDATPGSPEDAE